MVLYQVNIENPDGLSFGKEVLDNVNRKIIDGKICRSDGTVDGTLSHNVCCLLMYYDKTNNLFFFLCLAFCFLVKKKNYICLLTKVGIS